MCWCMKRAADSGGLKQMRRECIEFKKPNDYKRLLEEAESGQLYDGTYILHI